MTPSITNLTMTEAFYSQPLHHHIAWVYILSDGWMWTHVLSRVRPNGFHFSFMRRKIFTRCLSEGHLGGVYGRLFFIHFPQHQPVDGCCDCCDPVASCLYLHRCFATMRKGCWLLERKVCRHACMDPQLLRGLDAHFHWFTLRIGQQRSLTLLLWIW